MTARNNYAREHQESLFYHSLRQLKNNKQKDNKVVISHNGYTHTFDVVEEQANKIVLKNSTGKLFTIVQKNNPKWTPSTRRKKMFSNM